MKNLTVKQTEVKKYKQYMQSRFSWSSTILLKYNLLHVSTLFSHM